MTGCDDVASDVGTPRRMRCFAALSGGMRGAVRSRRGGAAIVGAVATPFRASRTRAGRAVGKLPALRAAFRSGGTSGRRGSGTVARHPAGRSAVRAAAPMLHR